jgi:hypothetical protein
MKKIYSLSIILLLTSFCSLSQKSVSYISKNRDTLFLPNNSTGRLILTSWNDVPEDKRPVIIFIEEDLIAQMQARKEDE